jgi:hypothetical protein
MLGWTGEIRPNGLKGKGSGTGGRRRPGGVEGWLAGPRGGEEAGPVGVAWASWAKKEMGCILSGGNLFEETWVQKQRFKLYPFKLLNQTKEIRIKPSFGNFSEIEFLEFGSKYLKFNPRT